MIRNTFVVVGLALAALALAGCEKKTVVEGQGGAKLELDKPGNVTVTRGEMEKVKVKISRKNLPGDVAIRFEKLPKGIDVVEPDNRILGDGTEATYTLRAAADADLVENSAADVIATGPTDISARQTFNVSVKEKK